jgi:catechol 2,3-dioxygenase-like lactoylglutathione lyase family enzyme
MRPLSEIALFTRDVPVTADFYRAFLGCDPVFQDGDIALFRSENFTLLIHAILDQGEGDLPFEDHIAVRVASADEACALLREHGIVPERSPRNYPWGRSAYLRDPDGRLVEVQEDSGGQH